jgi:hypothetical protein
MLTFGNTKEKTKDMKMEEHIVSPMSNEKEE